MSGPVCRPKQDRDERFEVYPQEGEAFELAVLRKAVQHHRHGAVILSILEPVVERATAPPAGSLHPEVVAGLELDERLSRLAETFPTLRGRPGVRPFDSRELRKAMTASWPGTGARHALRFVLSVAMRQAARPVEYTFDAVEALGAWDDAHRRAFCAWAARPWWP